MTRAGGWKIAALGVVATLSIGCVVELPLTSARPPPPDVGPSDGLLVAEVVIKSSELPRMDVVIDGAKAGSTGMGFIVVPVPAGEHWLEELSLQTVVWVRSSQGGFPVEQTRTVPIQRRFRIERGQITNLGLLAMSDIHGGLPTARFDNSADMRHFLRAFYPSLAQGMPMHLSLGGTSDRGVLEALRRGILADRFPLGRRQRYVIGDLGAVAELEYSEAGGGATQTLIDVPSISRVAAQASASDRSVFLTASGRLFLAQAGQVKEMVSPPLLRHPQVGIGARGDVIVVDDHREVYISADSGWNWRASSAIETEEVVSMNVACGDRGYFLYQAQPSWLLYSAYGAFDFKHIPLPPGCGEWDSCAKALTGF